MIITITDDGNGAWNLTALTAKDAWPPIHMAYGRNAWGICALVRGILTDWDADSRSSSEPQSDENGPPVPEPTTGPSDATQTPTARVLSPKELDYRRADER